MEDKTIEELLASYSDAVVYTNDCFRDGSNVELQTAARERDREHKAIIQRYEALLERIDKLENLLGSAQAHIINLSTALSWTKQIRPNEFEIAQCKDARVLNNMIDEALGRNNGS